MILTQNLVRIHTPALLLLLLSFSLPAVAQQVSLSNIRITTAVPGTRLPTGRQASVTLKVTADVTNKGNEALTAMLQYRSAGKKTTTEVAVPAHSEKNISLPDVVISEPELWWPCGYGEQPLYDLELKLQAGRETLADEQLTYGIKEVKTIVNADTRNKELTVNGQKIFIKGATYATPDMARPGSKTFTDAAMRYYRDMGLNTVFVTGAGQREFYEACDKYGLIAITGDQKTNAASILNDDIEIFTATETGTNAAFDQYNHYRALAEAAGMNMWKKYAGFKAAAHNLDNSAMEPTPAMYGLAEGCKPLHILYDMAGKEVRIANTTLKTMNKMHMWVTLYNAKGEDADLVSHFMKVPPGTCDAYANLQNTINMLAKEGWRFLALRLADAISGQVVDDNIYLIPDSARQYPDIGKAAVTATATMLGRGVADITLTAPSDGPVAFFNHLSLTNGVTKKSILPAFFNNNYISVLPGQSKTVRVEFSPIEDADALVTIEGRNVNKQTIAIKKQAE